MTMFIVCWTTKADKTDHWVAYDDDDQAREHFARLRSDETVWTVSLCSVLDSTDYISRD